MKNPAGTDETESPHRTSLLVIGGVTIDTIHLIGQPEPVTSPGGAGLFTALGARSAGGHVTLFAQRPDPLPEILRNIDSALNWQGPVIPLDELPRLEIAHFGGGKAELVSVAWGAQLRFDPQDLPSDLSNYSIVHVAALGPTKKQLECVQTCRQRGAMKISAGTYGRAAYGETVEVRALIEACEFFFMNENEARGIFGSVADVRAEVGKVVFVTLGSKGAIAVAPESRMAFPAPPVDEVNPTGAGDTFCGAVLAVLESGRPIEDAVETGVKLASESVGAQQFSGCDSEKSIPPRNRRDVLP